MPLTTVPLFFCLGNSEVFTPWRCLIFSSFKIHVETWELFPDFSAGNTTGWHHHPHSPLYWPQWIEGFILKKEHKLTNIPLWPWERFSIRDVPEWGLWCYACLCLASLEGLLLSRGVVFSQVADTGHPSSQAFWASASWCLIFPTGYGSNSKSSFPLPSFKEKKKNLLSRFSDWKIMVCVHQSRTFLIFGNHCFVEVLKLSLPIGPSRLSPRFF